MITSCETSVCLGDRDRRGAADAGVGQTSFDQSYQ